MVIILVIQKFLIQNKKIVLFYNGFLGKILLVVSAYEKTEKILNDPLPAHLPQNPLPSRKLIIHPSTLSFSFSFKTTNFAVIKI